jgi:hypothetical protein
MIDLIEEHENAFDSAGINLKSVSYVIDESDLQPERHHEQKI